MAIQLRATQQSIAAKVMAGLQANLTKTGKLQAQLSSGKLITRPSDSPTGTISAMQLRGEIRTQEQYSRNADDGLGWLSTLDTTLVTMGDQARRVQDLSLRGLNATNAGSPAAREALAAEIGNLRESLIGLANTRYLDRPVFGGITTGDVAYGQDGSYQGVVGEVRRTIGAGPTVRVDLDGPTVFGADGASSQLFGVLERIEAHLRAEPPLLDDLRTELGNLDTAVDRLQTNLSEVGARYNRVEQMRQTADNRILTLRSQLTEVEDIDLPKTIMEMKLQETAYQAALAASARVIQPSLMDYLR